jgi:hypothetical protein
MLTAQRINERGRFEDVEVKVESRRFLRRPNGQKRGTELKLKPQGDLDFIEVARALQPRVDEKHLPNPVIVRDGRQKLHAGRTYTVRQLKTGGSRIINFIELVGGENG